MIIGISSKAGGVGTSLVSLILAHGLALRNKRILLLSTDICNGIDCFIKKNTLNSEITLDRTLLGDNRRIKVRENLETIKMFYPFKYIKLEDEIEMYFKIEIFLKKSKKNYDYIIIDYKHSLSINEFFLKNTDKMIVISGEGDLYRNGMLGAFREIRETFEEKNDFLEMDNIKSKILCVLFNDAQYLKQEELNEKIKILKNRGIQVVTPLKRERIIEKLIFKGKTLWEIEDKRLIKAKESFLEIIDKIINIEEEYI